MDTESLLFISRQYHDFWQAGGKNGPLKTVAVNDFYQGVLLPPGTEEVELRYRPWIRWSWIPQMDYPAGGGVPYRKWQLDMPRFSRYCWW